MSSNSGKSSASKARSAAALTSSQAAVKDVNGIRINKSTNVIEYHLVPSNKWAAFDAASEYEKPLINYRRALCAKLNIQGFKSSPGDNFQLPCHQCRRRKPHFLICTKCHVSFCSKCLLSSEYEQKPGYTSQNDYVCPVCRKICKCSRCQAKNAPVVSKMHTRSSDTRRGTRASQATKEKAKQNDSEWYYDVDEIEEIKSDGEDDESPNAEAENDNSADYTEGSESEDIDDEISDFSDGEEEEDDDLDDSDNDSKSDSHKDEKREDSPQKNVKVRQGSTGLKKAESRRSSRSQRQRDFSNDEVIIPGIGVCIPKKIEVSIDVPSWKFVKEGETDEAGKQVDQEFDDSDEYYISIHNKMAKMLEEEDKKLIEPLNKKRKTAQPQRSPTPVEDKPETADSPSQKAGTSPVKDTKARAASLKSISDDFIYEDETGILDNLDYSEEKLYKRKAAQKQQKPSDEPVQKSSVKTLEAPVNAVKAQPTRRIKAPLIALPKSVLNPKPLQQPHSVLFGKSLSNTAKTEKGADAVKANASATVIKKDGEHKEIDKKEAINTQKEKADVAKKDGEKKDEDRSKREESKKDDHKKEEYHRRDEDRNVERRGESLDKHGKHHETKKPAVPSFLSMGTQKNYRSSSASTTAAQPPSSASTIQASTYQYNSIYANLFDNISTKINDAITSATGISTVQAPSSSLPQPPSATQTLSSTPPTSISSSSSSSSQPYPQYNYSPTTFPPPSQQQQHQSSYYNKPPPPPSQQPPQYNQMNQNGNYNTNPNNNYNMYNSRPYDNYSQPSYSQGPRYYDQQPSYHQQGMPPQYNNSWGYPRSTNSGPGYSGFRYSQDMCALCRVQQPTMMCPTCRAKLCSQECYTKHYNNEHYYKQYPRT